MNTKITPIGDRILVRPAEAAKTIGRILIPEGAREKPQQAIVIAVGTGRFTANGVSIPCPVKAGDKILISKYGGTDITVDGIEFKIAHTDDILAILG